MSVTTKKRKYYNDSEFTEETFIVTGPKDEEVYTKAVALFGSSDAGDSIVPVATNDEGHLVIAEKTTSFHKAVSTATVNETLVKDSAGKIHTIVAFNTSVSDAFLKLYNKATEPDVATDIPVLTLPLAAGENLVLELKDGIYFSAGIGYSITALVADDDNTAVDVADVIVNLVYA